jgi:hypothetical protein
MPVIALALVVGLHVEMALQDPDFFYLSDLGACSISILQRMTSDFYLEQGHRVLYLNEYCCQFSC